MFARSLGPAQSPGRSVYERELQRSNQQQSHPIDGDSSESSLLNSIRSIFPSFNSSSKRFPAFNSVVTPLPQTAGPRNPFAKPEVQIDEELAWFGSKLIWSRGSTIYRTFSYEQEKQKVTRALFAQFALEAALPDAHNSIIEDDDHPSGSGDFPTFGPYHTSQHAKWGKPEKKVDGTRRSPHSEQLKRCLVVVLEDWAHVYYPTGHDLVVTIPFPLAGAWALPSGGLMVQRERNSKETKRVNSRETQPHGPLKAQNGMSLDQTMETVLTELEADRMEGVLNKGISDEARLYSLRHPSSELQVVVETPLLQVGRTDTHGKTDRIERPTNVKPLGLETDVLWVSDEKSTPLAVGRDCMTNEIVFSRWACLPLVSSAEPEMSETKDVAEQEYASSVRNKSIPLSGSSKSKRMSLARQDSVNGTQLERRASIAARRSTGPVPNRRVSFHPEIPKAGKERMYPGVVPGADVDESVSARIKAEADLVRGMPHQRRTSHGMKENERFNGNYDIDFEVGETTMLHGIEANEDTIGFDVVLEEFGRWRIPTSRNVKDIRVFSSDQLDSESLHINVHLATELESRLYVFRISQTSVLGSGKAYSIREIATFPASSAVSVFSTRPGVKDVLTCNQGRLSIVTSHGQTLPLHIGPSDGSQIGHDPLKICSVANSIGFRVTAIMENKSALRLNLDQTFNSTTIQQILSALSLVLPSTAMFCVKYNVLKALKTSEMTTTNPLLERVGQALLETMGFTHHHRLLSETSCWDQMMLAARQDVRADVRMGSSISDSQSPLSSRIDHDTQHVDTAFIPMVMHALHMVCQEWLLQQSMVHEVTQLVPVLLALANCMGNHVWCDFWLRRFPSSSPSPLLPPSLTQAIELPTYLNTPVDMLEVLSQSIANRKLTVPRQAILQSVGDSDASKEYGISEVLPQLARLFAIYRCVVRRAVEPESVLLLMLELGVTAEWVNNLPWSIALPIWEIIRICRMTPRPVWPVEAYVLLDRIDMAAQLDLGFAPVEMDAVTEQVAPKSYTTYDSILAQLYPPSSSSHGQNELFDKKTMPDLPVPNIRFTSDRRLWDVDALLQTTRARTIKPEDRADISEEDRILYHQSLVLATGQRTISQVIGYALFTLDSKRPSNTEKFCIPNINLGVSLLPSATVLYPEIPLEELSWPIFHQGVGAGLSVERRNEAIDSSWIFFNRPEHPTPAFGGFLLGLGLCGKLRNLAAWHLYPNLASRQDHVSVGLLMGMAASYAGSQDQRLTTMLSSGVDALLPRGAAELNISPIMQATSIFSLGLLHVGSGRHRLVDTALAEIGRRHLPGLSVKTNHREVYAFSSAIALGLMMLGRGGLNREQDTRCVSVLRSYFVEVEQLDQDESSEQQDEGHDVNITAPGATLALGMMYLRTEREDIACQLSAPQNTFELDHVRPDMLIIRMLSYNMIMWKRIQPTQTWLDSQIPTFIQNAWRRKNREHLDEMVELAYFNILAGAGYALGLKFAGTMDQTAHIMLLKIFDVFSTQLRQNHSTYEAKVRRTALRQGFSIISIALALVVAGSGDTITYCRFRTMHDIEKMSFGTRTALHIAIGIVNVGSGRYSFGQSNLSIAAMAIAFFPRFTNSCDDNDAYLQAWRHLWALALEPRCVTTIETDTLQAAVMPIKLESRGPGGSTLTRTVVSPHLMEGLEEVEALVGSSPRYTSGGVELNSTMSSRRNFLRSQVMFVHRKPNALSYAEDPRGNRSITILANALQMSGSDTQCLMAGRMMQPVDLVNDMIIPEFTSNPLYNGFAQAFRTLSRSVGGGTGRFSLTEALRSSVLDAMLFNRPEVLPAYFGLVTGLDTQDPSRGPLNTLLLEFAIRYYASAMCEEQHQGGSSKSARVPLIRPHNLIVAKQSATRQSRSRPTNRTCPDEMYWKSFISAEALQISWSNLAVFLQTNNVPRLETLEDMHQAIDILNRRATNATASLKDRLTITRSALRKMAAAAANSGESTTHTIDIWNDISMTNALREWVL